MPAAPLAVAAREPRRARYLIPRDLPRRGEIIAALWALTLIGHLLLAQLTILLAVAFQVVSRVSRWRPQWLAVPAAAGFLWALAIGPAAALAGFADGPRRVLGYLAKTARDPANIVHLGTVFGGLGHWLPRQLPLALIVAAGEAAAAWWLRWLHTDQQDFPAPRPGLMVLAGRHLRSRSVAAGGVVTREGACLGIVARTGEQAAISWPEAERGVLCTGSSGAAVAATSFQVVHAAIRRRKPVIAVDLTGTGGLAESLAAVCEAAAAPLRIFGPSGPAYYEPLRGGDPARKAALVMGMIDWGAVADHARRTCGGYLNDLFAVAAAAPGDPDVPVIDDLVHLLSPPALRARVERVPPYHPRRAPLAERVRVSASLMQADPSAAAVLTEQLTGLRASHLGRWLRPEPLAGRSATSARISLSGIVRDRAVALFSLDQATYGRPAAMIANLVALDTAAVFAASRRLQAGGDGLAWFSHCEAVDHPALAALLGAGAQAGLAVLLGTASPEAAERVAGLANVLVIHRLDDAGLAARLAPLTAAAAHRGEPGAAAAPPAFPVAQAAAAGPSPLLGSWAADPGPGAAGSTLAGAPLVSPDALCRLRQDEFALTVKSPLRRVVPAGRFVYGGPR
jgi:hypothetical protein